MRKLELLSPAGDMEKLKMSVLYGADAVYLAGTSFGMRSFAGNFTPEELPLAVKFAHDHGVKAHVTVNTMPRNEEGTQVSHDDGVHAGVVQLFQIGGQMGNFIVSGHDVHGHMGLDTMIMGIFYRQGQFFRGEVSGKGPHTKAGTCQIHCVSAVKHGHFQPFHIPGRAQQF